MNESLSPDVSCFHGAITKREERKGIVDRVSNSKWMKIEKFNQAEICARLDDGGSAPGAAFALVFYCMCIRGNSVGFSSAVINYRSNREILSNLMDLLQCQRYQRGHDDRAENLQWYPSPIHPKKGAYI